MVVFPPTCIGFSTAPGFTGVPVQHEIPDHELRFAVGDDAAAAQEGAQTQHQLLPAEGLGHLVVAARGEYVRWPAHSGHQCRAHTVHRLRHQTARRDARAGRLESDDQRKR